LTPLFGAEKDLEDREVVTGPEKLAERLKPTSVYAIADYHFQKERWYGVQNVGALLQWRRAPGSNYDEKQPSFLKCLLPSFFDLSVEHNIPPAILSKPEESASICLKWSHCDSEDILDALPWIRFGVSQKAKQPEALFGISCPLFQRLKIQWISHFSSKNRIEEAFASSLKRQQSPSAPLDNDWWVPTVLLDPLGFLSSENRHTNTKWKGRYTVDCKLKVSTRAPFLFGSTMGDDPQSTMVCLECSLTDPNGSNPHATAARLETAIIPSEWLRSIQDTAHFALTHEQYNVI
jgi:hypothetical protein